MVGNPKLIASAYAGDYFVLGIPHHGSVLDIAGKGIANPISSIRSSALVLEHLGYIQEASRIYSAVDAVLLENKTVTPDLGGNATTLEVTNAIIGLL